MNSSPAMIATIRRTARSGDTRRAWRLFEAAGLLGSLDRDVLSLRGRLLKNKGLKTAGEERQRLLDEAEIAYLACAGEHRATYPLINAATIAFLNGKPDRARSIAQRTLDLLDSGDHEPETPYWLAATRAEAALLLGDSEAARAALAAAVAAAPEAWEDQAATLHQLEALLAAMGQPTDLLEPLRPPPGLHFGGLIGLAPDDHATTAAIEALLDEVAPGFVYGALAAGTDIVVAERAIARGARLHAVLPLPIDAFRAQSVEPFGADWARRFDTLIEQATEIETLTEQERISAAAVQLSEDIAMGLAIRRARVLAAHATALRVRRASDPLTPSDLAWRALGLPFREIVVERSIAPMSDVTAGGALRAVLAFNQSTLDLAGLPADARVEMTGGGAAIITADLAGAAAYAAARIAEQPTIQAGLDYRVIEGGLDEAAPAPAPHGDDRNDIDEIAEIADLAFHLARAAPAGGILAACPGALALELRAPALPFEAAGEIVTPIGDVAVAIHSGAD